MTGLTCLLHTNVMRSSDPIFCTTGIPCFTEESLSAAPCPPPEMTATAEDQLKEHEGEMVVQLNPQCLNRSIPIPAR